MVLKAIYRTRVPYTVSGAIFGLCTKNGSAYQKWLYVPNTVSGAIFGLCTKNGSAYQKWLYVPNTVCVPKTDAMRNTVHAYEIQYSVPLNGRIPNTVYAYQKQPRVLKMEHVYDL